jgi:DNA-binding NarL/FixJ family response regulator
MFSRPAIFLVDDHSDFCEAASKPLRDTFDIVGSAHDANSAVTDVSRLNPDVVVIDVCMRILDAVEAGRKIREASPPARLLFVALTADGSPRTKLLNIGPLEFLIAISDMSQLSSAISNVLDGHEQRNDENGQGSQLTRREREVVQLLAEGKLMKQVAEVLNVSPRTVAFHKYGVMRKLGLHSSAELVRMAVTEGLIA